MLFTQMVKQEQQEQLRGKLELKQTSSLQLLKIVLLATSPRAGIDT
jgi:hypothetical protein